jgi:hypothetical protein
LADRVGSPDLMRCGPCVDLGGKLLRQLYGADRVAAARTVWSEPVLPESAIC